MQSGKSGEDYNVCSGKKITLNEITKLLLKLLDKTELNIKCNKKSYPGDIEKWYGNPAKLNKLGFQIQVNLNDGLEKVINYKEIAE